MRRQVKEKVERALGQKLFLKAERCNSPKCVTVRRPYRPGVHGKDRRRRNLSEYGKQLQEKQKLQIVYGLSNRQLRAIFESERGNPTRVATALEKRLDRVTHLLGLAPSMRVARQAVSHGHILVNGRPVTVASYAVRRGDVVQVRPASLTKGLFAGLPERLAKYEPPEWLTLEALAARGTRVGDPLPEAFETSDVSLVGQFYTR